MYIKFKNPYKFEEQAYEGIEIDFDSISGDDLEKAQTTLAIQRKPLGSSMPEGSKAYCAQVAAFAAHKPAEFIRGLPAREYVKITMETQSFLLDGASEMEDTQQTS